MTSELGKSPQLNSALLDILRKADAVMDESMNWNSMPSWNNNTKDAPAHYLTGGALWFVLIDVDGSEGEPTYVIQSVLRPVLTNYPHFIKDVDKSFDYYSDQVALEHACTNPKRFERAQIKGILDLRARPRRIEIAGRRYAPYLTSYDVVMKMVE